MFLILGVCSILARPVDMKGNRIGSPHKAILMGNRFFVLDGQTRMVAVLDENRFLSYFSSRSTGQPLRQIRAIAADEKKKEIYCLDGDKGRISVLDPDGRPRREFQLEGEKASGEFRNVSDMAMDGSTLWVAYANGPVHLRAFGTDGRLKREFPGLVELPPGLYEDFALVPDKEKSVVHMVSLFRADWVTVSTRTLSVVSTRSAGTILKNSAPDTYRRIQDLLREYGIKPAAPNCGDSFTNFSRPVWVRGGFQQPQIGMKVPGKANAIPCVSVNKSGQPVSWSAIGLDHDHFCQYLDYLGSYVLSIDYDGHIYIKR